MTAQSNVVHEQFPNWLLLALPNVAADIVDKRRKALTTLIPSLTDVSLDVVVDFVRVLFELPRKGDIAEARLRQACVDHDPRFANGAAAHEMAILAGTVLVGLITQGMTGADAAVLGISCANARGGRRTDRAAPFVSVARDVRRKAALAAVRESVLPPMPKELSSSLAEDEESVDAGALSDYVRTVVVDSERLLNQFREELDATWWVVGEYSRDLDEPIRQIRGDHAPVILAKELADMTRSDVGPLAAKAVLHRVLELPKRVPASLTIADAVEKLPAPWRAEWVRTMMGRATLDGVTPVLAAASRHEELNGKDAWRPAFEQTCSLSAATKFSSLDLATQVYDESLLVRLLRQDSHSLSRA